MYNNLIERLKEHEGYREKVYNDHLGNPTIGYGFLVSSLRLDRETCDIILKQIVSRNVEEIKKSLPWFDEAHEDVQGVIIEMSYQLGIGGLLSFKNTLKFMKNKNWTLAAEGMRNSRWHSQTPKRCESLADIIESQNSWERRKQDVR